MVFGNPLEQIDWKVRTIANEATTFVKNVEDPQLPAQDFYYLWLNYFFELAAVDSLPSDLIADYAREYLHSSPPFNTFKNEFNKEITNQVQQKQGLQLK